MAKKKGPRLPPLIEVSERPGMGIVNRYMPDATDEAKEEVYENLKQFVRVLHSINVRLKVATIANTTQTPKPGRASGV